MKINAYVKKQGTVSLPQIQSPVALIFKEEEVQPSILCVVILRGVFGSREKERKRREKRENWNKSCAYTEKVKVRVTKLWGSLYSQTQSVKIQKCLTYEIT